MKALIPFLLRTCLLLTFATAQVSAKSWTLIGWNNLGMHCMDSDYTVFSILPPYNTIHAQLIDGNGLLVKSASGITVTYQATADPTGSENRTSVAKTNFWDHVSQLYGAAVSPDEGLSGKKMPGNFNQPQAMTFDPANAWFIAEGIPITPYDDQGHKNPYPMMRLVAKDSTGQVLATTDIVLPVSDEMDCRACHSSGSGPAGQPAAGWVNDPNSDLDYRLNILRLHDEIQSASATYQGLLQSKAYDSGGLFATVKSDQKAILCASCHASNALAGTGANGVPPLTRSVHSRHATVADPTTGISLNDTANRSACYRCHPGSETRCLRGVMANMVAGDGSRAIQCQSCHGTMSMVGTADREGWLDEPNCQSCHTGTALTNQGQIRYTTTMDAAGKVRTPADSRFATTPGVPAAGFSLYRFSSGHGGLACEGCHGSTHAEFTSSHSSDNLQSQRMQGHDGPLADCSTCHVSVSLAASAGPHGMHAVGQQWVQAHPDIADDGRAAACRDCHGIDYRGTVLSQALGDRTLSTRFGTKTFFQHAVIGCYACHNGPNSESANSNQRPTVGDLSVIATPGVASRVALVGSDANILTFRVISQPAAGTVFVQGTDAIYTPDLSASGSDVFTYSAWDGSIDSNLGRVSVTLAVPPANRAPQVQAVQQQSVLAGQVVTLTATATDPDGDLVTYAWTQLSGPPVALNGADSAACSFTAPSVSQLTTLMFHVTVSDGRGGTATTDVKVTVAPSFVPQTTLYFPQIANGESAGLQLKSTLYIFSPSGPAQLSVASFDSVGKELSLPWSGQQNAGASVPLQLNQGQSMVLPTNGTGSLQAGWLKVEANAPLSATVLFTLTDPETGIKLSDAGILPGAATTRFTIFVDSIGTADTAVAILNPPDQAGANANLALHLYGEDGNLLSSKNVVLADGNQLARFMRELFDDVQPQAGEMQGTMSVVSDQPVIGLTIRQTFDATKGFPASISVLTVLPVLNDVAR